MYADRNLVIIEILFMEYLKKIKTAIERNDLFCSSQMLRYKDDTQYKTLTGGIISLAIIIAIVVGFAGMINDTINKNSITFDSTTLKSTDPSLIKLSTSKGSKFMFGLEIESIQLNYNHDLNGPKRYFDVSMTQLSLSGGGLAGYSNIPLQKCTKQHWSQFPSVLINYQKLNIDHWLCPELNFQIPLSGSYTSDWADLVQILVSPCNNLTDLNRSCQTQSEIDNLFQSYQNFYFTIYYINPVINPGNKDYMSYYLDDKTYAIFSKTSGAQNILYFADYSLTTDESFWPYEQKSFDNGVIVVDNSNNQAYQLFQGSSYISFVIFKSKTSLVINRSVQKISTVISYMGGLIGAVTALLFLVKTYTDASFEMSIGSVIFKQDQTSKNLQKSSFHMFDFIKLHFYRFMQTIGYKKKWAKTQFLKDCMEEMSKQLDIVILLKRIIFLQRSLTYLFEDYQLKGLEFQARIQTEEAKNLRKTQHTIQHTLLTQNNQQNIKNIRENAKIQGVSNLIFETESQNQDINKNNNNIIVSKSKEQQISIQNQALSEYISEIPVIFLNKKKMQKQQLSINQQVSAFGIKRSQTSKSQMSNETIQKLRLLKDAANKGDQISMKIWNKINPKVRSQFEQ